MTDADYCLHLSTVLVLLLSVYEETDMVNCCLHISVVLLHYKQRLRCMLNVVIFQNLSDMLEICCTCIICTDACYLCNFYTHWWNLKVTLLFCINCASPTCVVGHTVIIIIGTDYLMLLSQILLEWLAQT